MAALQLLSLLLLMTSPALADPGPGRSADGRRHAAPLPQGRFPAERLVPPNFRGPNVLEKLAAGTQGEGEGVHAENLAWIFEHVGHAMKAQDKKTRRLREENGATGDAGGAQRRLAGEQQPIPESDTPDGYCGSHGWALKQKPDKPEFEDASLPCAEGGASKEEGGCDGGLAGYQFLTKFETGKEEDGMTFDYFIAWGWAQKDGGRTEWSPYMAACLYARYDKGLKVNVDENGNVEENPITIDQVKGISCEGCKVDMSVDAQLALFVEVNTDYDNETPDLNDLYTNFEVWTCVEIKFLRRFLNLRVDLHTIDATRA